MKDEELIENILTIYQAIFEGIAEGKRKCEKY